MTIKGPKDKEHKPTSQEERVFWMAVHNNRSLLPSEEFTVRLIKQVESLEHKIATRLSKALK